MKATGIVRKIDELGRIVIPKELRRTLRIENGDSLEIYTNDEDIILKKYSIFKGLEKHKVNEYAKTLHQILGGDVLICDKEKICASTGANQKSYKNKELHRDISGIFKQDEFISLLLHGNDIIKVTAEDKEFNTQIISPIRYDNCDIVGAVISLTMADFDAEILDYMTKTTASIASLIGHTFFC